MFMEDICKLSKMCLQEINTRSLKILGSHFYKTLIFLLLVLLLGHKKTKFFHKISITMKSKLQEAFFTYQIGKEKKRRARKRERTTQTKIHSICLHGKKQILSPCNENISSYSLYGKLFENIHKKAKFCTCFDPIITLLRTYCKGIIITICKRFLQ